jgi:spermidine synthase
MLSILLISPPAFFMGGTVPVMAQHLIRDSREFGRSASFLYGINTLGGAIGALLAGFVLPLVLGYRLSFCLALTITIGVALSAWRMSLRPDSIAAKEPRRTDAKGDKVAEVLPRSALLILCFISGFCVLALEVAWTQMLAQVFQNTVYTFAAILVTILLGLAAGAAIANRLARKDWKPAKILYGLVLASGIAVGTSPFICALMTDNMKILYSTHGWAGYIANVFVITVVVIGIPACVLGAIFPYLMKTVEARVVSSGKTLGELSGINTAGAIVGSLAAGFVLIGWFGIWHCIQIFSIAYLLVAILLPVSLKKLSPAWRSAALVVLLLHVYPLNPSRLPVVLLDGSRYGEELVEVWQSSSGTVAVTRTPLDGFDDNLQIKLNGHYGLGSSSAASVERAQAEIPMALHPQAESIFFLGMGTGITAGEALSPRYGIRRVVTCELVPEVVTAARKYFGAYTNGLFTDSRSEVYVEDGRHYLAGTGDSFDIICSDLFIPYRSGAGSLYTLEHFKIVRERLNTGGVFVLWVPLYQVSKREFGIIARTMTEAFPQVTLWRSHFVARQDTVAFVARAEVLPLPESRLEHPSRAVLGMSLSDIAQLSPRFSDSEMLLTYCCNLSEVSEIFKDDPINRDDHPLIEYLTPKSSSMQASDQLVWFAGPKFVGFLGEAMTLCPPEEDPYLANRTGAQRALVRAGHSLAMTYLLLDVAEKDLSGKRDIWIFEAAKSLREFQKHWAGN